MSYRTTIHQVGGLRGAEVTAFSNAVLHPNPVCASSNLLASGCATDGRHGLGPGSSEGEFNTELIIAETIVRFCSLGVSAGF